VDHESLLTQNFAWGGCCAFKAPGGSRKQLLAGGGNRHTPAMSAFYGLRP
jgi:hypothetical protein